MDMTKSLFVLRRFGGILALLGIVGASSFGCKTECLPRSHRSGDLCVADSPGVAMGDADNGVAEAGGIAPTGGNGGSEPEHSTSVSPGGRGVAGTPSARAQDGGVGPSAATTPIGASGIAGTNAPAMNAPPVSNSAGNGSGTGGSMAAAPSTPSCVPATETCDNADNDCDGKVDEDVTKMCGKNVGICKPGTVACHNGTWEDEATQCQGAVMPMAAEACDQTQLDENCNGISNEGCNCQDGDMMPCGNSNPPCKQGQTVCMNGKWPTECQGAVEGIEEICDGVDNDCSGRADDAGDALCQSGKRCAGALKCVECITNQDCSGRAAMTCKAWSCNSSSHTCQQQNAEQGTACGAGNKCNAGSCVRCITDGDCPSGQECASNACKQKVFCGNGTVDSGEKCDGNCPTSCNPSSDPCLVNELVGNVEDCTRKCQSSPVEPSGIRADKCCPSGGNPVNDADCARVLCGNGQLDATAGEICDATSATKCIQQERFCTSAAQCFPGDTAQQAMHLCTYSSDGVTCSVIGGC